MTRPSAVAAYLTVTAAQVMGGVSLLLLGVFLLRGPFHFVDLHLSTPVALFLDGFLCLAFSVQHSGMVRQSFHQRPEAVVPVWTVWVVLGTVLEERDLVSHFGESYAKYQRDAPMLIPWRVSSSADSK